MMRSLDMNQLVFVAGGGPNVTEAMTIGAGVGAGLGANAALGLSGGSLAGLAAVSGPAVAITVGSAAVGGVVAAGYAGYMVGTAINNNMPDEWRTAIGKGIDGAIEGIKDIAKAIDELFNNG